MGTVERNDALHGWTIRQNLFDDVAKLFPNENNFALRVIEHVGDFWSCQSPVHTDNHIFGLRRTVEQFKIYVGTFAHKGNARIGLTALSNQSLRNTVRCIVQL